MTDIIIREAKRGDARKIHELMQQQIAEQKSVLPPHLTQEVLEKNGWDRAAVFVAFVAEYTGAKDGQLEGYILAHHAYAVWDGRAIFIRELYVVPALRRLGVATRLCKALLQAAVSMGCKLCDVSVNKGNMAAVSLFEKLGAQNTTEVEDWHLFSVDKKGLTEIKAKCKGSLGPVKVRRAVPEDMVSVRDMIQELADYQKMPDAPQVSVQSLVADSPPNGTLFECFVAESDGTLVGYVMQYCNFSCQGRNIFMEDFYVKPAYRGQGLGKLLMAHVAECGLARGANYLEFCCLSWNTSSIAFYEHMGATNLTTAKGHQLYRFAPSALKKSFQHK